MWLHRGEVDFGRKIPCHTGDSNLHQYYTRLFSRTLCQLSYPHPFTLWALILCLSLVCEFLFLQSFIFRWVQQALFSYHLLCFASSVCLQYWFTWKKSKPSDYSMTSVMLSGFLVAGCATDCSVGVYYYGCMTLSGCDFTWWYMQIIHTIHWSCYIVWFCHSIRQHRPSQAPQACWKPTRMGQKITG